MSTVIQRTATDRATGEARSASPHGVAPAMVATWVLALATAGLAAWSGWTVSGGRWLVVAIVAASWAVAGVAVALRRRDTPLGLLLVLLGLTTALTLAAAAAADTGGGTAALAVRALGLGMIPAVACNLALAVPEGRLGSASLRWTAGIGYLIGVAAAVGLWSVRPRVDLRGLVAESVLLACTAVVVFIRRCRSATPLARARLQWIGWSVVTALAVGLVAWALDTLVGWPGQPGMVALVATMVVPAAFVATTVEPLLLRADRLIVHSFVVFGLIGLVAVIYFLVIIGLGRVPEDHEKTLLGLSMVAAALAVVLALPVRRRLEEVANQRVYGERRAPDDTLRTFATRMSRVIPMDELLLQLAESLRKTMDLTVAEVWTGGDGVYERVASVPNRGGARLTLSSEELTVVARAHVSGNAWMQVWLPSLLEGRRDRILRVASVAHLGQLLGLLVLERPPDAPGFTDDEDQVLNDLARQVGLALHNVNLDSALQDSLDEVRMRNEELRASQLRIVAAADESRRHIERNLHDGAQQHLVAMAVKLGLARQLVGADRESAESILEELRSDVQETLTELRELAHGIYPPLLRDRGLAEALVTAANRAVLPVDLDAGGVGRYPSETEAAVYFCCLEAMQNAGKYAGEGARITVRLRPEPDTLTFEVEDDGPGFDPTAAADGHGFVNMRDRLGALGGGLEVRSSAAGTQIIGVIPASAAEGDSG